MNKHEASFVKFGMEIAEVVRQYWFDKVVLFLKGENEEGGIYFDRLKPLYDKYGYTMVNDFLIKVYNEKPKEANNE